MALSEIQLKQKQKGGKGGLFGKILGGIVGAIGGALAPVTGGASAIGGAAAGSALGSTAGSLVGSAVDPAKVTGGRGVSQLQSAAKVDPQVQLAQLTDSLKAAQGLPKVQQEEIFPTLLQAQDELRKRAKVV